ncbi:MAG: dTDP-4-dehydrorhamnose 3,5-epimerase [Nanoarchaeota archaeon]
MKFTEQIIKGVYEIQLEPREDERGFFMRAYDDHIFREQGLHRNWVHENHSLSKIKGNVRGLHFQYAPDSETKLLRVITGEIFLVYVDLRKGSPTLGKWGSIVLSGEKKNMVYVSRGFVGGMCTLTDNVHLYYKVDNYYAQKNEDNIKWNDPDLGIKWPIQTPSVISQRDENAQSFKDFLNKSGGGILVDYSKP